MTATMKKNFKMFVERNARGLTQAMLADRVGVTANHLTRVENNLSKPSYKLAVRIAAELGTPTEEMFPGYREFK